MIFNNFVGIQLGPTSVEGFKLLTRSITSIKETGVKKHDLHILLDK